MNAAHQKLLQDGLRLHQAGQLAEAAALYKQVIDQDPNNADALDLMGAIFYASGNLEMAITFAEAAISVQPAYFAPYVNLGNALQASGRMEEAISAFQKALDLNAKNPHAANNLASAFNALGRFEEGLDAAGKALVLDMTMAEAHNNLGNSQVGLGQKEDAINSFQAAVRLNSELTDAQFNMGTMLLETGEPDQALFPLTKSIQLDPASPVKHYNLGNAYRQLERYDEAIGSYRAAIALKPNYADALSNLGAVQQTLGQLTDAISTFRQAVAIESDSADLHWNLSLALIQNGDFSEGWQEHEWRWQNPAFKEPRLEFNQPRWEGQSLEGKTILIHAEQGLGDAIMFARYIPMVVELGGRVVLECRKPLLRLLERIDGVAELVVRDEPLPDFDCYIPHNSLPVAFGTTLDTIPAMVPYLWPPESGQVDPRLSAADGFKVGFVWAGSPTNADDKNRSVSFEHFETLFDIAGATFFSLQVGDHAGKPNSTMVTDLAPGFSDFADTATAIAALDLVISVDTSVAHLAGALGKPVWTLLPHAGEWRWLHDRDDSPWYPSMKLFRQTKRGDWSEVFERAKSELSGII
jgi:tetratricopeptide (TPR) repeat protein